MHPELKFWLIYVSLGAFSWLCLQAQGHTGHIPRAEQGLKGLFAQAIAWPMYIIAGTVFVIKRMWN